MFSFFLCPDRTSPSFPPPHPDRGVRRYGMTGAQEGREGYHCFKVFKNPPIHPPPPTAARPVPLGRSAMETRSIRSMPIYADGGERTEKRLLGWILKNTLRSVERGRKKIWGTNGSFRVLTPASLVSGCGWGIGRPRQIRGGCRGAQIVI